MSIIVPVYNVESYIRRCIESIVNQKEFNFFEVIIINDGTMDGSIEKIQDIVFKHPNIHLIHQKNLGLSEARNTGLLLAKGDFISFVDSDDWIEPDMISSMYHAAVKAKSEIAICNIRVVYEDNIKLKRSISHSFDKQHIISSHHAINLFFDHKKINGQVCNKLFKSELFKDHAIYFPKGKTFEDLSTCFALLWHSAAVVFLDDYFYNYLQRKGSITKKANLDFWHKIENVYLIKKFLVQKNLYERYSEKFSELLLTMLFNVYIHLQKYKKDESYALLKDKLNEELSKFDFKNAVFLTKFHPTVRLKFIIMSLKMDRIIDLILTMKAYKNKVNV